MRWGEKTQKTSDELRWVEMMRWNEMTQTAVTVGCSEQFPREAAMRWDQMRWEKVQHSRIMAWDWQVKRCCCEAQEACLSPIGTAFASFYRLQVFKIWNFRPQLARVLLGYDAKIQKNHQTGESQGCLFVKEILQTRRQGSGAWDSWLVRCTEAHQACCYSNPNPTRR